MPLSERTTPPGDSWYRFLVESARQYAVLSMDLTNRVVTWNPGAQLLFGYTAEEAVGRDASFIFTPEDNREGLPEKERRTAYEKEAALDERWHVRKDGSRFWASGLMMTLKDDAGQIVGFLKIVRDRTEQRQLRDTVAVAEERYRLVNRATTDVIWDWNILTGELNWNEAAVLHYGFTPEETKGTIKNWYERIHADDRQRVSESLDRALKGRGEVWSDEYQFRCREGRYAHVFDRGFIARDGTGKAVRMVGTMLDITEDKRAERILRQAHEQLRNYARELEVRVGERTKELTETIDALEMFSYSAAHDLRTPVRSILGLIEIVLTDFSDTTGSEAREYLHKIHKAAMRMDRLLMDLLDYGRATRAEIVVERINLGALVQSVIEEEKESRRGRSEWFDIEPSLPAVSGHSTMLRLALVNLIGNAVKFVKPGVEPRVRIRAERRGERVRLWIEDEGIGIDSKYHPRIYRLFERLHSEAMYPGTGVGLAIVKQTIQRMGGTTGFESEAGKGSRFWIELPAAEQAR